ncbi:MAG: hypothetical protein M4579_005132 [Chaenotheca gracillima]|nr:MAG: hypothetical protein M4579_005132 [Chaenotheca gracillima]
MAGEAFAALLAAGTHWSPDSWRSKPIAQEIIYPDQAELEAACQRLRSMPPLVAPARIEVARRELAEAARGNAFVIQGGDCAESFDDVRGDIVGAKRALVARQGEMLHAGLGKPIVEIGRIAGQYAKPRSALGEMLADGTIATPFKGDNINSRQLNVCGRQPDPTRLLVGHHLAATTLAMLKIVERQACRSCTSLSGHGPAPKSDSSSQSQSEATGAPALSRPRGWYTSHEALNLHLESALTHGNYNTSAEFLWVGERTRHREGAHVEYVRGLRNPVGIKLGPTADAAELVALLAVLNPSKEVGRVTLITRLGASNVERTLPPLIQAVRASGQLPVWMCDPCHGNTVVTTMGVKTRLVESIVAEIKSTYEVHQRCASYLGGLHLEQTGEDVTECVDGGSSSLDHPLLRFPRYHSLCDPRLSGAQALHVVQAFVDLVRERSRDGLPEILYQIPIHGLTVHENAAEIGKEMEMKKSVTLESSHLVGQLVT